MCYVRNKNRNNKLERGNNMKEIKIKALEATKVELSEARLNMKYTLADKIAELEVTKEELEALQEELGTDTPELLAQAKRELHIGKKLQFLINDYQVGEKVRVGIMVIDDTIEFLKNLEDEQE